MEMVIHIDRCRGMQRDVRLAVRDGRLSLHCGCAAAAHGQVCCHMLELLLAARDGDARHAGRADGVDEDGAQMLTRVRRLLPGDLLGALDEPQRLLDGERFSELCQTGVCIGPTARELLLAAPSAEPPVAARPPL